MSNFNVLVINAAKITDPVNPMRSEIDRDAIWELAESIKKEGLINPITVRPVGEFYEVVAGHRRFSACKIAGVIEIPCVVRDLSDDQVVGVMAHENFFRQDIDPVDEALFLAKLLNSTEDNIAAIAAKMNHTEVWVQERLTILQYPDYMLVALRAGTLKLGVARWLGLIEDDFWRKQYVDSAVNQGMSVLQARYLHDQWKMGILPNSADVLPSNVDLGGGEPPAARAICAACQKVAIDPNLRSVFVHRECPSDISTANPPPLPTEER